MAITPIDIQQQRFKTSFRGYETKAVEEFLEQTASAFEDLQREIHHLSDQNQKLQSEVEEYQQREGTFKRALLHSQKVLDQMQENARQQADMVLAEAETKAEKLLQQAQNRVAQLQDAIAELKRQRIQLEEEISCVLETHRRMLETGRLSARELDEHSEKLKVLKPAL
jgi:cell division initiation protein